MFSTTYPCENAFLNKILTKMYIELNRAKINKCLTEH